MKQAEKIDKIFYAVFGTNGGDGLVKRLSSLENKMDGLFKRWDNREDTCGIGEEVKNMRKDLTGKYDRMANKIIAILIAVVITVIATGVVEVFIK